MDEARVKGIEIRDLISNWGLFKGNKISENHYRLWLEQFDDVFQQRLIYKLSSNLKFYDEVEIQSKLSNLFRKIQKANKKRIGTKTIYTDEKTTGRKLMNRKRNNYLVSYVDGPGKSGAYYAKKFADNNNINSHNVTTPDSLFKKLGQSDNIDSIVFVDDFIGTGDSISSNLSKFLKSNSDYLMKFEKLSIDIAIIVGFSDTKHKIESSLSKYFENVSIHIEDILNESDKAFSEQSRMLSLIHI